MNNNQERTEFEVDIGLVFGELITLTERTSAAIKKILDRTFLKDECKNIKTSLEYIQKFYNICALNFYVEHQNGYNGYIEILHMFIEFCENKNLLHNCMVLFEEINKNFDEYHKFHIALTHLSRISLIFARILDITSDAEGSRFNEEIYPEFRNRQTRLDFRELITKCYDKLTHFVGEIDKTLIYFDTDAQKYIVTVHIHESIKNRYTNTKTNTAANPKTGKINFNLDTIKTKVKKSFKLFVDANIKDVNVHTNKIDHPNFLNSDFVHNAEIGFLLGTSWQILYEVGTNYWFNRPMEFKRILINGTKGGVSTAIVCGVVSFGHSLWQQTEIGAITSGVVAFSGRLIGKHKSETYAHAAKDAAKVGGKTFVTSGLSIGVMTFTKALLVGVGGTFIGSSAIAFGVPIALGGCVTFGMKRLLNRKKDKNT